MVVAQERYESWKPARRPPLRFCDLTVTIRAANLTFAVPEPTEGSAGGDDGEGAGAPVEEIIARDVVVVVKISEQDSINDINLQISGALRSVNATSSVPITVAPYFAALLGPILLDVPILNFSLPPSLQIAI